MAIGPASVSLNGPPRDPAPLGLALRACVIATIIMTLVLAATDALELAAWPDVSAPEMAIPIWYAAYVYAPYAMWVVFFLTLIALIWLTSRLARNLHALAPGRFVVSPTYAAGWYLVPIANLFMPPRVTGLIARETFALTGDTRRRNTAIGWWWGAFLATALLANVATSVAVDSGAFDPDRPFDAIKYEASLVIGLAAWAANLIASVCMLRVFGPLTRAQSMLVRKWRAPSASGA